jgi:prevent-host-death family protein
MTNTALDLEADIKPVSDFRANAAETIRQVQATGRPVVLTQRGRSSAVVMDVASYQAMVRELDELRDVQRGLADAQQNRVTEHDAARASLLADFPE